MNEVVPFAPPDSCLTREDFLGPDFSPDAILTRQPNLERLREDLGLYLKILRSAVLRLIDEDYSDFLELSSNLVGLESKLSELSEPLGTLSNKLQNLLQSLFEARDSVMQALKRKEDIRARKSGLRNSERILNALSKLELILSSGTPLSGDAEERLARDINHLHFRISKCHDDEFVSLELTPRLQAVGDRLKESLESRFIAALKINEEESLKRCLRIYGTIESIHEAEILVKNKIISPSLEDILHEDAFNDEPLGLKGVYANVLNIIPETLDSLLSLTISRSNKPVVIRGYSFLINSLWEDFVEKMEDNMSFVFAAGNPEAFLTHYRLSIEFIKDFEKELNNDPEQISKFRSCTSYSTFIGRWNLPVYFQIRFQEIALPLEKALTDFFDPTSYSNSDYHLEVFNVVTNSLKKVWDPSIYIDALLHRSWKLTLQILSRCGTALRDILKPIMIEEEEHQHSEISLRTLIHLWYDIRHLTLHFESDVYNPYIFPVLKESVQDESLRSRLLESVNESLGSLRPQLDDLSKLAINKVTFKSLESLKQVSEIPRLYRRTNKDVPTKHCVYVNKVLDPVRKFKDDGASESEWLVKILSRISEDYYVKVSEVLEAVLKMEESLKRLKRIREKSDASTLPGSSSLNADEKIRISDNDKIRLQIKVDVEYFNQSIQEGFGLQSNGDISKLEDLMRIVNEATKDIPV
uniref:Conserved oligomeric Golgi complex subunit 2 n=1 Tax=Lepeophtheirus salmonis TaxID=72036 RepID=A0A0K2V242_LEPSM